MGGSPIGTAQPAQVPDVEILESWYPMLIEERTVQHGAIGAGRARAGGGNQMSFTPHGTDRLIGQMLAMRAYVALEGAAGGRPGAVTRMAIRRPDGSRQPVSTAAAGVVLEAGESFEILCASGGGVGDPLLRPADRVAADVARGRISAAEASEAYGVAIRPDGSVDGSATGRRRRSTLARRLRQAAPGPRPVDDDGRPVPEGPRIGLYPGVVQVGSRAYAEASGAPLADAPAHFTDGCPVLESAPGPGPGIVTRTYLDPRTGHALMVEVVPAGFPRAFAVAPARWG